MARYIRTISGYNEPIAKEWRVAASKTIKEGDIVELDATSRYLQPASAGSETIVGVALESITTGAQVTPKDKIKIIPATGCVFRVKFTGSVKTTLADTDLATTQFDLADAQTIDLDDTTDGMCRVVGYDNNLGYADIIIDKANVVEIG